ncbi:MAG: AI-2E family transporter, partial [Cyanobacteria bacterium P01_C01_bin.73]
MPSTDRRISISLGSVVLLIAAVPLLVLLWQLKSLILLVMISVVLASSIAPVVDWAEAKRVPRWLAVILIYLSLISILVLAGLLVGPTIFEQIERLIRQIPVSLKSLAATAENWVMQLNDTRPELVNDLFGQFLDVQGITRWAIRSSQQLLVRSYGVTTGILGGFFSVVLALFISGYMLADSRTLIKNLVRLLPVPWDERFAAQVGPISYRIGGYIRGRLLVSAILAVGTSVSLSFLGLSDFAFGLGAIAGVTNLIPFIGP